MQKVLRYKMVPIFIIALVGGWYAHNYYYLHIADRSQDSVQIRENSSEHRFINPLILVANKRNIESNDHKDLEDQIEDVVNGYLNKNNSDSVSYYFRDLNSNEWVGVNPDDLFAPSSMLKVSTLMAYSKLADKDSKFLLEKIFYKPTDVSGQFYKPAQLKEGTYLVKELLQQMIVESDNDAMRALNALHPKEIVQIYNDLEISGFSSEDQDFMSPRYYSRMFRAIYNGSYISRFYSDEALELLTYTKFDKGIKSATEDMVVAHKFGELTNKTNEVVQNRELHDCGIVYYPEKPYFICVMTKGQDFVKLEQIIGDISRITFDYIKNKK